MKSAYFWISVVLAALFLWGVVTPWMINQDSFITLAAVPFMWVAFLQLARRAHAKIFNPGVTP